MNRVLSVALILFVGSGASFGQERSVLQIKVVLAEPGQTPTPVPNHVLLISDNPPSAPPRQVITAADGTADVKLSPGNYTVESDRPVAFRGRAYQWIQIVDVLSGTGAVLELTADNAEVESLTPGTTASTVSLEDDPSFLLSRWQDSVVALWTPSTHASGFVVDGKGLIATNQRVIGTAVSVEVQIAPAIKVAATVLAADPERDVAVLWIDPKIVESVRPVPLGCAQEAPPSVVRGQDLFAIGSPLRGQKGMTYGTVDRVKPKIVVSDLTLAPGSAGGPVFTAGGVVVGIASVVDGEHDDRHRDSRVVPVEDVCLVVASAEEQMNGRSPPPGTHLPVEPVRPFPVSALKDAAKGRAGSLNPYQISSPDFDVAFITPVHIYGVQYQADRMRERARGGDARMRIVEPAFVRPLMDFRNWSEYVSDFPPVLLVRATPKLVEGFWTTVGRAAARTQGVSLPPIKRVKSGFSRMRAFCGDTEVTPIHPFVLEQRVSQTEAIHEGLYVFDPGALGPHCGSVKLVMYSDKEPEKGDTRVVDPNVIQQIWEDFAAYRALSG